MNSIRSTKLARKLSTRNRAETVMNRAKPWPYSTVPRPMEPKVFYGFKLTAPLNNRSNGFWLDAHGAVRFRWHSYGAVRCGFKKLGNLTVRFGAVFRCREPYGAVRLYFLSYGAVRCGFQMSWTLRCGSVIFFVLLCGSVRFSDIVKPTVRCGAVNRTEPHRTDRKNRTVKSPDISEALTVLFYSGTYSGIVVELLLFYRRVPYIYTRTRHEYK